MGVRGETFRRLCAAATILALCGVSRARPDINPDTDPEIATMLAGLKDESFLVRERASIDLQKMVELQRLSEDDLFELASRSGCTPEQRVRLLDAARMSFMTTERAGMGIGYESARGLGIRLTTVEKGFPCAKDGLLRVDDILTSIGGIPMTDLEIEQLIGAGGVVRCSIISHDPGDVVKVKLRRELACPPDPRDERWNDPALVDWRLLESVPDEIPGWTTMMVDVPLGNISNLAQGNNFGLALQDLQLAWMLRLNRRLEADPSSSPAIRVADATTPALSPVSGADDDDQLADTAGRGSLRDPMNTRSTYTLRSNAQVNNEARRQEQLALQALRARQAANVRIVGGAYVVTEVPDPAPVASDPVIVMQAMRELEVRLLALERRIARAGAGEDRADLVVQHDELNEQLRTLAAQLDPGVTR